MTVVEVKKWRGIQVVAGLVNDDDDDNNNNEMNVNVLVNQWACYKQQLFTVSS